jgi:hypothetical protein
MLVHARSEGELSPEERCKALVQEILQLAPDKDIDAYKLRQKLVREHVVPDEYRGPDGLRVRVFGPLRDQEDFRPDTAYTVSARFLEGPREGQLMRISLFGPGNFFDGYKKLT